MSPSVRVCMRANESPHGHVCVCFCVGWYNINAPWCGVAPVWHQKGSREEKQPETSFLNSTTKHCRDDMHAPEHAHVPFVPMMAAFYGINKYKWLKAKCPEHVLHRKNRVDAVFCSYLKATFSHVSHYLKSFPEPFGNLQQAILNCRDTCIEATTECSDVTSTEETTGQPKHLYCFIKALCSKFFT